MGPGGAACGQELCNSYGSEYYDSHCVKNAPHPYRKGEAHWEGFFGGVADEIVRSLRPRSVFDAGCAVGFLVEALWDRGVEAHGRDISEFAISQLRPDVRPYCTVGSIADPIDGSFDLVSCIEVLEHMPADSASLAIANMTSVTDRVLFSSTPTDFDEETHINVHPTIHWVREFASHGFGPRLSFDAGFLSPQALLFERSDRPITEDDLFGAVELVKCRIQLAEMRVQSARQATIDSHRWLERLDLEHRYTAHVNELRESQRELARARRELDSLRRSKVMRYSRQARSLYTRARQIAARPSQAADDQSVLREATTFDVWVREFDTLDEASREALRNRLAALTVRPLVSVLLPVHDPPEPFLRAALDSVLAQLYSDWELCVVDDCSSAPWVPKVLEEYTHSDSRIRPIRRETNGHISAASNTALDMSSGEWVALLDHDDVLSENALAEAVLAVAHRPDAALLYSDEDNIDENGKRSSPFFKPDFDSLLLLAENYLCHMTMARLDIVREVGGFREGFEGAQDWDLVLRLSERLRREQVVHVPRILYHWRRHEGSTAAGLGAKPYAIDAGRRVVIDHLARVQRQADVLANPVTGHLRVRWPLPDVQPLVSIVIPTRDGRYLRPCIESIFRLTTYPHFEVIVVDNGSVEETTRALFNEYGPSISVVRDERPFNYSALNNAAVKHCRGDVLCLLNDDCEVIEGDWLGEMVSHLMQQGVGAVGAKLLYEDGRIQHAGVILGIRGVASHAHLFADGQAYGYGGWLHTPRSLSAVTAACMVIRRDLFEQLGGFDELNLAVSFNDVDLCLRVREAGWQIVWTPFARLVHRESVTRGISQPHLAAQEAIYVQRKWGEMLTHDPAYNPNLSLESCNFDLAFPPRL